MKPILLLLLLHLPLVFASAFINDYRTKTPRLSSSSSSVFENHPIRRTRRRQTITESPSSFSSSALFQASSYDYSKWDNLADDDDDDDDAGAETPSTSKSDNKNETKAAIIPKDMVYNAINIKRQAKTHDAIAAIGNPDLIATVWLRSPSDRRAWFVGRVSFVSDLTATQAIEKQYPLIERHAWALRPNELHPSRGPFVVYFSGGDIAEESSTAALELVRVKEKDARRGAGAIDRAWVGFVGADSSQDVAVEIGHEEEEEEEEEEVVMPAQEEKLELGKEDDNENLKEKEEDGDQSKSSATKKTKDDFDVDYTQFDFSVPGTDNDAFQ